MQDLIKREIRDTKQLLRVIPSTVMVFFCLSVILMNLFANKEISLNLSWLALDCGVTLSWLSFLCMDILTKRFGPKAAVKVSMVAIFFNLFVCALFKLVAILPGVWGEFYTFENWAVNEALDNTIGGTWYVLMGSTIALVVSAIVNACLNHGIGLMLHEDGFTTFALRSYISTLVAQFVDNLTFALIVSYHFFGWSLTQCITCSLTGCIVELLCEIVFSPIGYKVSKKWEEEKVGEDYIKGGVYQ